MTTDSPFYDRFPLQSPQDLSAEMGEHTNESTGATNMVKRDCFELLSAYLDGEVTAAERKQVEEWLANDASVQCLYTRLLKLRQGLRTCPVPAAKQLPEVTAQQVFQCVHRRSLPLWTLGGAAIAACAIGAVSGWLPSGEFRTPQLAQQTATPTQGTETSVVSTSPLMVALNNPVIEIPKAAVTAPEQSIDLEQPALGKIKPNIN